MLVSGVACADTKTSKAQANLKQETQKQLSSGTEKTTHSEKEEFSNQQLYGRSAESISFKKGKAPKNWRPVPGSGTTQSDVNWLYSYVWWAPANLLSECGLALRGYCLEYIPSDRRKKIVADCRKESTAMAKALCASKKIHRMFLKKNAKNKKDTKKNAKNKKDTYVCRHHAIALWWILDDLGLPSNLECSFKHSWIETEIDGKRVIFDAYNNIYIMLD